MKPIFAILLSTLAIGFAQRPASTAANRSKTAQAKLKQAKSKPVASRITASAVNNPNAPMPRASGSSAVRAQILLDRLGFSPGEIDGSWGRNTLTALGAYRQSRNLPIPTGSQPAMDQATWRALNSDAPAVLMPYTISGDDVKGPFTPIPSDMMEKAKLDFLGYTSPLEELGERFHCNPQVLRALNPGVAFDSPGQELTVPSVRNPIVAKAAKIIVSKSESTVSALDAEGKLIAQYPSSSGSEHDPLPLGEWKINGVAHNPKFHYNPALFWDADGTQSKATIAAGPNNPVGPVWIDLSKEHYGIHGTPEPSQVGHTESHGCIRLTNWDAQELAGMVAKGTIAILKE